MTSKITENNKNILHAGLYIVATPIGNLSDISFRAIDTLKNVDLIACEDTRVSKILLDKYGIQTPTTSVHNYNESDRIDFLKSQIPSHIIIIKSGLAFGSHGSYRTIS